MNTKTRGSKSRTSSRRNKSNPFRSNGKKQRSNSSPFKKGRGNFSRGRFSNSRNKSRKTGSFDVLKYINKNPAPQEDTPTYKPAHSFKDFRLSSNLLFAISRAGLNSPTQIQDKIIPHILNKKDVVGSANTGTGKTAAFLIPLIELTKKEDGRQTLILTPTRELAIQISQELKQLSANMKIYSTVCVGGVNIHPQISGLKKKNHFIIGTPGRVLDLINRKIIQPEKFSTVVLDEADRMLDMGFIDDIKKILNKKSENRETLFFSATIPPSIEKLIQTFSKDPITVSVRKQDITNNIEQDVVQIGKREKSEILVELLNQKKLEHVLVFVAMKRSAERLKTHLLSSGISAESIQGNKTHTQRQRSLKLFKDNKVRVLVATDVAARGIHVDMISHVINYDLPSTYEDYVHRIGRTGRGINLGKALTFVK